MKKVLLLFAIIGHCFLHTSCETCGERDMTLAGSISSSMFSRYSFTATGEYDGVSLGHMADSFIGGLNFTKLSDTEVYMNFGVDWGEERTRLEISTYIPLDGEPDNVTFDYTGTNATVTYDGAEYYPVSISVKGRIRHENYHPQATRCSPADQVFLCEIEIECVLDGKKLNLVLSLPELSE